MFLSVPYETRIAQDALGIRQGLFLIRLFGILFLCVLIMFLSMIYFCLRFSCWNEIFPVFVITKGKICPPKLKNLRHADHGHHLILGSNWEVESVVLMWDSATCAQNISPKFPTILLQKLGNFCKIKQQWISQNIAVEISKFPLQTWTSFTSLLINFGGFGRGFNVPGLQLPFENCAAGRNVDFWKKYLQLSIWLLQELF